ncbi:MAG TPA: PorP/SprF family type IX secretion system membrane protein, partial [Chitinophagaceae bacterium]|nr:PorP/SprF family type IX secretion system membrane protein [Chitinophagaceae bacterium]
QISGKWRFISNFRDQWIGPASPYATGTVSFDSKVMQEKMGDNNTFGIGGMMLYDHVMQGALKSASISLNSSYNVVLSSGDITHRLGIGVGGIFANKRVDYSKLNFGEQFNGYGFDTNLPTGESALSQMKPYLSASAGVLYSVSTDYSNIDIGVAGYHLNKPKQSVLEDPNQFLAPRYVGHANFETYLNTELVLNTNAIYQRQSTTSYVSVGGALGYFLTGDPEDIVLSAGVWYWSKNAVIPYIGVSYQNMQFGLTYDITVSKLSRAEEKPKSFELSIIIRGTNRNKGVIWCPWK